MKKSFSLILVCLFTLTVLKPLEARAEIPVKAKAFMTIAGYGTAAGALLGAASMAFGGSTRNVAQGASLGLYAGILFGTYVLVSHHQKRYGTYDDRSSPYQESSDVYSDEYREDEGGSSGSGSRGGFFDRFEVMQEKFHGEAFSLGDKKRGSKLPPLHINLLNLEF